MKDKGRLISILAFLALIISGVLAVTLTLVDVFTDDTVNVRPFQLIASSLTTIVVVWVGWQFAKDLKVFWKVFYLIVSILALLGAVSTLIF